MLLLENPIRAYAWGAPDGLAALVGAHPSGGPEAELWVGTHPGAPSVVSGGEHDGRTLAEVIAADPTRWLGSDLAAAGHTALPFLLKILAIGQPLSLQAHPSTEQAEAGFAREEAARIPIDAAERSYKDASPKPEALVAYRRGAVSFDKAVQTLKRFEGVVEQATEDELSQAAAKADRTGMFNCPHTGVALACLEKLVAAGTIQRGQRVIVAPLAAIRTARPLLRLQR